jgi:hypothetical protein
VTLASCVNREIFICLLLLLLLSVVLQVLLSLLTLLLSGDVLSES